MNKLSGLYFGPLMMSEIGLKKAVVLYDELRFIDRPSFNLGGPMGTVGMDSPFRRLPEYFSNSSLIIECHKPLSGPVSAALRESIEADVQDALFIRAFSDAFKGEFAYLFVQAQAEYNSGRKAEKRVKGEVLVEAMRRCRLPDVLPTIGEISSFPPERQYDPDDNEGLVITLLWFAIEASHALNNVLAAASILESVPFTDFPGYQALLVAKYKRAQRSDEFKLPAQAKLSFVSHSVLDEVLSGENLKRVDLEGLLKYRDRASDDLTRFREFTRALNAKIEGAAATREFETEMEKLLALEVVPKVREFKDGLTSAWEDVFKFAAGSVTAGGAASISMTVFEKMPLGNLVSVGLAGSIAAWSAKPVVDFLVGRRRAARANGLAYLLRI